MFGPVAFIHTYQRDEDLSNYFQDVDGRYNANRMYVSVYGESKYVQSRDDNVTPGGAGNIGIVLRNQTIHDVEIGYNAYGGFCLGASGVIKKTQHGTKRVAQPVLLPEVVSRYLIKNEELDGQQQGTQANKATRSIKTGKDIDPIIQSFQELALEVFGDNLAFGFVFGSAVKGKLKVKGENRHDLDTFACLKEHDPDAEAEYKRRLQRLHHRYGLKVDTDFPCELMTVSELQDSVERCKSEDVSIDEEISGSKFDGIFWSHALTDKKTGFIGDGRAMSAIIKKTQPNIDRWGKSIISQLEDSETVPAHVREKFCGLGKDAIVEKMKHLGNHLTIHLGLRYSNSPEEQMSLAA